MTFLTTPTYFQLTSALKKNGHFWWLWHSDLNNAERSKLQYHIHLRSSLLPSNWVMTFSLGISVGKRDTVSFFLPFIPCTLSYFSRVNVKKERIGKKKKEEEEEGAESYLPRAVVIGLLLFSVTPWCRQCSPRWLLWPLRFTPDALVYLPIPILALLCEAARDYFLSSIHMAYNGGDKQRATVSNPLRVCMLNCSVVSNSLPVHGISQERILEWVAISFSRGSSQPRDWTLIFCVSCIGR